MDEAEYGKITDLFIDYNKTKTAKKIVLFNGKFSSNFFCI